MTPITNKDEINRLISEMEKSALFDYAGPYRHPKYPNVNYFLRCIDSLFEHAINNVNILGFKREYCERLYDIERNDYRKFKIMIIEKEKLARQTKNIDKKAFLYEEIVEIMQQEIGRIRNEFLLNQT